MKRRYKKQSAFDPKRLWFAFFTLFVVFVAFKILTPPNRELARIDSPDGAKTARLRKFFYVSQPSYKVDYRDAGKLVWLNLLYLPSYTNVPHASASEAIEWSADSRTLFFRINGSNIWRHRFPE